jgi:hypothetical protein
MLELTTTRPPAAATSTAAVAAHEPARAATSPPPRGDRPGVGPAAGEGGPPTAAFARGHGFDRVTVLPPIGAQAPERSALEQTQPPGDDDDVLSADDKRLLRSFGVTTAMFDLPWPVKEGPAQEGVRTVLMPAAPPRTSVGAAAPGRRPGPEAVAHAVVAPGGAATVVNPGAANDCTPAIAGTVLNWNVVAADADNWRPDVVSLALAGTINIKPWPSDPAHMVVPNTANPVDGGNINNTAGSSNRWQAAIDDMADYDTAAGGAGPNWHSTGASIAHETAHWTGDYVGDAVTSAAGGNWAQANADLDALREPKASSATSAAARTALQPRVAARLATWRTATLNRWNTLITTTDNPGSGGRGYAAGAAVLAGLIAAVRTFATGKGWIAAPAPPAGPAPAPPGPPPAPPPGPAPHAPAPAPAP